MVARTDDDGWTSVEGATEPADRIEFSDFAFLDEVTHPLRGAIVRRLKKPRTIAETAAALDVPVTRLYHHFGRLEDAGIIRVVATRQVAAVTERRYQIVAHSLAVPPRLFESLDPADLAIALGSLFDSAKLGLQREIEDGTLAHGLDNDESMLFLGNLTLTQERRRELIARLESVVEEFSSNADGDDPDTARVALLIAAYTETD